LSTSHSLNVTGLTCATTYHYQVSSTDAAGNTAVTPDATFTTAACGSSSGPDIDVWYGLEQSFGHLANSQVLITIPGTATSPAGLNAVSYRLNGGSPRTVHLGPDGKRLAEPGDFIIELDRSTLPSGPNQVVITATDVNGGSTSESVVVDHTTGQIGPLPMSIDWSTVGNLLEVVEPMEGRWKVSGSEVAPTHPEYDRLLALGDVTWTDYEVTIPITLHEIDPNGTGYQSPSNGPALGFGLRWLGHSGSGQPRIDWWPTGAFVWYRMQQPNFNRFELVGNQGKYKDSSPNTPVFLEGQTFVYKARVETGADGRSTYRFKVWNVTTSEPTDWLLDITTDPTDPAAGSVLLIAHEVDASFGTVTVTPIP
jgi:hypothetical protein